MNQHLQSLLDFVRQDNNLTPDKKDHLSKELSGLEEEITIAESNHERTQQIEASLEKVRARTMAMHRSEELQEAASLLFQQVKMLGIETWGTGFNIWEADGVSLIDWMTGPDGSFLPPCRIPLDEFWLWQVSSDAKRRGEDFLEIRVEGNKLKEVYEYLSSLPDIKRVIEERGLAGLNPPESVVNNYAFFQQGSLLFITYEPRPDVQDIFKRFAKVFEQTYTRFLDLQKAEAQTRESQIQLALERVRARTMAMQHSEELAETASEMFKQIQDLGMHPWGCGFNIFDKDEKAVSQWMSIADGGISPTFRTPLTEDPFFINIYEARQQGEELLVMESSGASLEETYRYMFSLPDSGKIFGDIEKSGFEMPKFQITHCAYFSQGYLVFITYEPVPESWDIFKRFAKVFEQTYTRFLDLQKAEGQAREARIEAALEKVRSRTMAMQHSNELKDVALALFQQVNELGIPAWAAGFNVWQPGNTSYIDWMTGPTGEFMEPYTVDLTTHPIFKAISEAKQSGEDFGVFNLEGKSLVETYELLGSFVDKKQFQKILDSGFQFPTRQTNHYVFGSQVGLLFITYDPYPEGWDIFKRFGKVFEQTYTRFLDLQTAEAQARESQIQLAMERVRARTMAMQRSDELADTAALLFQQIKSLGVPPWSCGFNIWEQGDTFFTSYMGSAEGVILPAYKIPLREEATFIHFQESRDRGDKLFVDALEGETIETHYRYFQTLPGIKEIFEKRAQAGFPLPTFQINHLANFSHGNLLFITYEPCPEAHDIFIRFAAVFEQTYTRFLDLQTAEAQSRESQIQLAMERVRAKTMAMQHSEELGETASLLFKQIADLGTKSWSSGFDIWEADDISATAWMSNPDGSMGKPFIVPYTEDPFFKQIYAARQSGTDFFVMESSGKELEETYQYLFNLPDAKKHFDGVESLGFQVPTFQITHCAFFSQGFLMFITYEPVPEMWDVFKRFAIVFDQTYTRFLDLQNSEAQAKESQIQLALERVRARTMAMQRSEELQDAALLLFRQLRALNVPLIASGFNIWDADKKAATAWMAIEDIISPPFKLSSAEDAFVAVYEAAQSGESLFVLELSGEELETHLRYLRTIPVFKAHTEKIFDEGHPFPTFQILHCAFFSQGYLTIITYERVPEAHDIFKRFAKVFEQTYTRFLDLQKAEGQAREARIEAALEKVRARAMAMHSSEDLALTVSLFFAELRSLQVTPRRCGVSLIKKGTRIAEFAATVSTEDGDSREMTGQLDLVGHQVLDSVYDHWISQTEYHPILQGDEIRKYYQVMNPQVEFPEFPRDASQFGHYFFFKEGFVFAWTEKALKEEELQIFRKYTSVLSLTYRRYMDLQEAEANTREAQIEASLERVRTRTMAMHNSEDVGSAIASMFTELEKLGVENSRCGIANIHTDQSMEVWSVTTDADGKILKEAGSLDVKAHPLWRILFEEWEKKEEFRHYYLAGKEKEDYINLLNALPNYLTHPIQQFPDMHFQGYFFGEGAIWTFSMQPHSDEDKLVMKKFTSVFSLTFRRYQDLKKAEAQAKEAIKASSLDRVRAEIASMRTIDDLQRITPIVWQELTALGVPFMRCGVFIIDEASTSIQVYLSAPDGHSLGVMNLPFNASTLTSNSVDHWRKGLVYTTHWNKEEFLSWMQTLIDQGQVQDRALYQGAETPPESLYLHFVPFAQGMLYVGGMNSLETHELDLVEALAEAFSIAYARYEDFKKLEEAKSIVETTLTELKSTQSQLIQSEKMASLGELTAGIAHEIQNPLNFVNNFSEVSNELIDEMKVELRTGNEQEALMLADDVKQNLSKILHHGKRADAIVKGMLQHSRTSSLIKEPTDINKLADEYLRLAYHGFRAKDKSFNASMKTEYDERLSAGKDGNGNINVIPQDIGRVLLNLFNNGFYAVTEKKKQVGGNYEPAILLTTNKNNGRVEISVKDNGNGIPTRVKDKIFQPFFTTKPTGHGTGLGLSLAYDIIKAHGGELKVETKEGEGSEFIIHIPITD